MNILNDVIKVNKAAFFKTIKSIYFVPILAIVLILKTGLEQFLFGILSSSIHSFDFLLGFIRFIVDATLYSALISILSDIIFFDKFDINRVLSGYKNYIIPVSSVMFIKNLASILLNNFIPNILISFSFYIFVMHLFNFALSALTEEIYIGQEDGLNAFVKGFKFIKENIFQWGAVAILYSIITYRYNLTFLTLLIVRSWSGTIFNAVLLSFIYIFKGHLFNILHTSSMRKREFQEGLGK